MDLVSQFPLDFLGLAVLLLLSGFFSGSETALFSLSREQLRRLEAAPSATSRAILSLTAKPEETLAAILFGNMVVNVLFFSISYRISTWAVKNHGATEAAVFHAVTFLLLVTFGEVTPKGVAVARPLFCARAACLPLLFFFRAFGPVRLGLARFARRMVSVFRPDPRDQVYVGADELRMLLEMSEKEGAIDSSAGAMMQRVMALRELRLREIMTPRVDLAAFDLADSPEAFMALARRVRHKRIPVYEESVDHIVGVVRARNVFLDPSRPVRDHAAPVRFVPETKTVESMLREFRERQEKLAVVVDEYGGTAGIIVLEDILEVVVGEIEDEFDQARPLITPIGPNAYRIAADLGIHDWGDAFPVEIEAMRFGTVGGFVASLLGRLPREGDAVVYRGLRFTVEEVRKRRVQSLRVETIASPSDEEGLA